MLTEVIIAISLGVVAGTFTGLIPGIHINLISALIVGSSSSLLSFTNEINVALFIISMSITHSFLDVIPSTYLGAPDPDKALMALPAHKMLLEGRAYEAIRLTVIGSYVCLIISCLLSPLIYLFFKYSYNLINANIFWILISTTCYMILKDKNKMLNLLMFFMAGILGLVALNLPLIKEPLLPMLSGLFGCSILINSLNDKVDVPKQNYDFEIISFKEKSIAIIGGFIAGTMTSFLPGLGSSQGAVIASNILRKISDKGFLIMIGGINTVNFCMSMVAYYAIQKARNGSIIAIKTIIPEFNFTTIFVFLIVSLLVGSFCVKFCLQLTKGFSIVIGRVNYQKTIIGVLIVITMMILIRSNLYGLILYFASIALGLIAIKLNVAKNHLMGCLLLPVILYFIPF